MMSVIEKISRVVDRWFLYEPLLFNTYCTHKLEENTQSCAHSEQGKGALNIIQSFLKNIQMRILSLP